MGENIGHSGLFLSANIFWWGKGCQVLTGGGETGLRLQYAIWGDGAVNWRGKSGLEKSIIDEQRWDEPREADRDKWSFSILMTNLSFFSYSTAKYICMFCFVLLSMSSDLFWEQILVYLLSVFTHTPTHTHTQPGTSGKIPSIHPNLQNANLPHPALNPVLSVPFYPP